MVYPVAIIVPTDYFLQMEADESSEGKINTSRLLQELRMWCIHHHLDIIEIPSNIYVERNPGTSFVCVWFHLF
jgi:hypothetical protein